MENVGLLISSALDRLDPDHPTRRSKCASLHTVVILECALSVLLGNAATAQTPATELRLQPGARVRVSSSTPGPFGSAKVGTVLAQHEDTLSLRPEGTQDSLALLLGSITQLEVSAGHSSHVGRGMGLEFLTGGLTGVAIGAATYTRPSCGSTTYFCIDLGPGASAAAGGVVGGLLGTVVGAFIGAVRQTENWEQVTVTARKLGFRLAPFGKDGIMVSATF